MYRKYLINIKKIIKFKLVFPLQIQMLKFRKLLLSQNQIISKFKLFMLKMGLYQMKAQENILKLMILNYITKLQHQRINMKLEILNLYLNYQKNMELLTQKNQHNMDGSLLREKLEIMDIIVKYRLLKIQKNRLMYII